MLETKWEITKMIAMYQQLRLIASNKKNSRKKGENIEKLNFRQVKNRKKDIWMDWM